jgi:hypothetical protein
MKDYRSFVKRFIVAAGVAAGVLGSAALGGPAAGADSPPLRAVPAAVAPALSILGVETRGTEATAIVTSSVPTAVSYELEPVSTTPPPSRPPRGPLGGVINPLDTGGVATTRDTPPPATFERKHGLPLRNLTSNTTYDLFVAATTQSGQRLTAQTRFTTRPQRVSVTLDKIVVHNDGDTWLRGGEGEPTWYWAVEGFAGGPVRECFPRARAGCRAGHTSEGTISRPLTDSGQRFAFVFAEENFLTDPRPEAEDFTTMPQTFVLRADASESDVDLPPVDFDPINLFNGPAVRWQAPKGQESAEQQVTLRVSDNGFDSTMYFTFRLFHDTASYPPNVGRVHSTSK